MTCVTSVLPIDTSTDSRITRPSLSGPLREIGVGLPRSDVRLITRHNYVGAVGSCIRFLLLSRGAEIRGQEC